MWSRCLVFVFCLWLVAVCSAQTESLPVCDPAPQQAAALTVSTYTASAFKTFIRLENGILWDGTESYSVRGLNYMPAQTPQYHFLIDTPDAVVRSDLGKFQAIGLNTIRIFLWHDGLFMCEGSGTVPLPGAVRFLDRFFHMAAESGFRVIVTLNDQPDLDSYPIYENPSHTWQQFEYLITRYATEPAILAWDVRSGGDVDYGANPDQPARFTKERVLTWLRRAARAIKRIDTNHLVTASWQYSAVDTLPYVDFVSLHRPTSLDEVRRQVGEVATSATPKPILLVGFGLSTFTESEAEQSAQIISHMRYADESSLLGWLVWQAYDFPVNRICQPMPCREAENASLHEGLWASDDTEKAAVQDIKLYMRSAPSLLETLVPSALTTITAAPNLLTQSATPLTTETPLPPTSPPFITGRNTSFIVLCGGLYHTPIGDRLIRSIQVFNFHHTPI